MNLGHILKLIRVHKNLNQQEMSKLLGLSQNYLSLIESDKRGPSRDKVAGFAESLGISKEGLLFVSSEVPVELEEEDQKTFVELQKNILSLLLFDITGRLRESA